MNIRDIHEIENELAEIESKKTEYKSQQDIAKNMRKDINTMPQIGN